MKSIDSYIFEKLKIDNFTNVSRDFKKGEHMSLIWIERFEDEDTHEIIPFLRIDADALIFKEIDDDSFILYDYNDKNRHSDETYVYKNSNGYYQDKTSTTVFLSNEDMLFFLEELVKLGEDDDLLEFLYNYIDKGSIDNRQKGIALAYNNNLEKIKKIIRSLKKKIK